MVCSGFGSCWDDVAEYFMQVQEIILNWVHDWMPWLQRSQGEEIRKAAEPRRQRQQSPKTRKSFHTRALVSGFLQSTFHIFYKPNRLLCCGLALSHGRLRGMVTVVISQLLKDATGRLRV